MKRRDWIPFASMLVAQTALLLGIGAFGFHRLEARMDRMDARMDRMEARMDRMEARMDERMGRIEDRLDNLDRRVARIEGILRIRVEDDGQASSPRSSDERPANSEAR